MNQSDNRLPFSEADIRKVLGTDEGRKLLAYLSRDGGAVLKQAAETRRSGGCQTDPVSHDADTGSPGSCG